MNKIFDHEIISVERLLTFISQREWTKACLLIETNPELLSQKGTVTAPSGQIFEDITPFQLALYNHDRLFWEKILDHLSSAEAATQFHESQIKTTTYVRIHGSFYNPSSLITAYKCYTLNYARWTNERRVYGWITQIGGELRRLPMRWAAEYCRPDRSFVPTPHFDDNPDSDCTLLLAGKKVSWFAPKNQDSKMGVDYAVMRAGRTQHAVAIEPYCTSPGLVRIDMRALEKLFAVNMDERNALCQRLAPRAGL